MPYLGFCNFSCIKYGIVVSPVTLLHTPDGLSHKETEDFKESFVEMASYDW